MGNGRPADPRARPRGIGVWKAAFVAVLALWVVLGFGSARGQDALPYVAAGSLVATHPEDIYTGGGNVFDVSDRFRERWCADAPVGTDCDGAAVAYVATPQVLPVAVLLHRLGGGTGTLILAVAAAAMLAAGMWMLWGRLVNRTSRAPLILVMTALCATPMAMMPIALGQTSPILFLSVCLGLAGTRSRRQVVQGATWMAATLLKLFPALLVVLLVFRHRRRALASAAAVAVVSTAAALVMAPGSIWSDFVGNLGGMNQVAARYFDNGSVSAGVVRLLGAQDPSTLVSTIAQLVAVAAAAMLCLVCMPRRGDDTRWAVGYLALLVAVPIVWAHYLCVLLAIFAVVLAERKDLSDRKLMALPLVAVAVGLPALLNAHVPNEARPTIQLCILLGVCVMTVWAARGPVAIASDLTDEAAGQRSW